MVLGFVPLAVRRCLDVFRDISIHPGLPKVPCQKLEYLLFSEVSYHFTVMFGFEISVDYRHRNIEMASVVENVGCLHCQTLGWFDISGAIWVCAAATQT